MARLKLLYKTIAIFGMILCFSTIKAQSCIGVQGNATWSYWGALNDDEYEELYANPKYPDYPDKTLKVYSISAPIKFDNYFGSTLRGYIKSPVTEKVAFNITGDDDCKFYLSSDETASNLKLTCYVDGYTSIAQHDKYPEQTSDSISLVANQYYYFEVHHVEGGGSDHVSVYWKNTVVGFDEYKIVGTEYIYDYNCTVEACPPKGTFCNDADPTTTNDQQDGFCNCKGSPITSNSCLGDRDKVRVYRYDDISGNYLTYLYQDPDFPFTPSTSYDIDELALGTRNNQDNFGSMIQGFINVPISGNYQFNVTGSNQTGFYLSNDDDIANKEDNYIFTINSTNPTEYDKDPKQTSEVIYLDSNNYYFFELNHKEGSGVEHFSIFWKTPNETNQWKRIPSIYLYDYSCTLACVPDATLCDDGDIYTKEDQYVDCDCIGTPCEAPDCDNYEANYIPYEKCGFTDQLDTIPGASWLSCTKNTNPNPLRGESHWIQYDLGNLHKVFETQVWNYNVSGQTDLGFLNVAIDYSVDGTNWIELNTFNWPEAPGTEDYAGFPGPDFDGIQLQHILITSLDVDDNCRGLSKIKFYVRECHPEGTRCDDENPDTFDDRYDENCDCIGKTGNPDYCSQDTIMLGDSILTQSYYHAILFLESESQVVKNTLVDLKAAKAIELSPGFDSEKGVVLNLQLEDCPNQDIIIDEEVFERLAKNGSDNPLRIEYIDQDLELLKIIYFVEKPGIVSLDILNKDGTLNRKIINHDFINGGFYSKYIPLKNLEEQNFLVRLSTKQNNASLPLKNPNN